MAIIAFNLIEHRIGFYQMTYFEYKFKYQHIKKYWIGNLLWSVAKYSFKHSIPASTFKLDVNQYLWAVINTVFSYIKEKLQLIVELTSVISQKLEAQ